MKTSLFSGFIFSVLLACSACGGEESMDTNGVDEQEAVQVETSGYRCYNVVKKICKGTGYIVDRCSQCGGDACGTTTRRICYYR